MLRIRPFSLPLARPLVTGAGSITAREGFLVRVGDTPTGVGEATPLPGWTESLDACRQALENAEERATQAGIDRMLQQMHAAPAARHGLSLAVADQQARRAGTPLYRHLGGATLVRNVSVNATIGDGSIASTVRAAEAAVDEGYSCLKLKIGVGSVERDLERLRAVREAVGEGVALRADANAAWGPEQARHAIDELAALDLEYLEQPLPADDLDGLARLGRGNVPIALDESLVDTTIEDIIEAGAADVIVVKPMVLGGLDRARQIATTARSAGVEPVVTTTIDAAVARTAAVHLAASLAPLPPCGVATAGWLGDDVADDPARVEGGTVAVPQRPGTGVTVGEDTA